MWDFLLITLLFSLIIITTQEYWINMTPAQDAFAALRYRDFSIVTINQFCLTLAILIQEIIVA